MLGMVVMLQRVDSLESLILSSDVHASPGIRHTLPLSQPLPLGR